MKNKTSKNLSVTKIAAVGAGIASLAASAYFFFGPKGKQNQKHLKAWAIKMKADVIEKLEKARDVSEPIYHQIIDSISEKYKKGMKDGHDEIEELAQSLKKHWKTISGTKKMTKKIAKK